MCLSPGRVWTRQGRPPARQWRVKAGARGEREGRRADPPDCPVVRPRCPEGGTKPASPPARSGTAPGGESGSGAGLRAGGPPSCRLPPHSPPPPLPPHRPGATPAVRLAPGLASLANTVYLLKHYSFITSMQSVQIRLCACCLRLYFRPFPQSMVFT